MIGVSEWVGGWVGGGERKSVRGRKCVDGVCGGKERERERRQRQ